MYKVIHFNGYLDKVHGELESWLEIMGSDITIEHYSITSDKSIHIISVLYKEV